MNSGSTNINNLITYMYIVLFPKKPIRHQACLIFVDVHAFQQNRNIEKQ